MKTPSLSGRWWQIPSLVLESETFTWFQQAVSAAVALLSGSDYSSLCLLQTKPALLLHVNEPSHTTESVALAWEVLAGLWLCGLSLWSCPLLSFPVLWKPSGKWK